VWTEFAFDAAYLRVINGEETATDPVTQLLLLVASGPLPPSAIQTALGLKHRPTFRANYLYPALEGGFIEMTLPDKPASRLQKYRLTAAGQALLRNTPAK
jgi:hypothetical protein